MQYLIDSNAVIDYLASRFSGDNLVRMRDVFNTSFAISVITKIEVLGFIPDDESLNTKTSAFLDLATVYDLSAAVVAKTVDIRKAHKIKIPDAIIAATSIVNGLTLITRNIKDFKAIDGLTVIDPYTI